MIPSVELGSMLMKYLESSMPDLSATTVRLGILCLNIFIAVSFFRKHRKKGVHPHSSTSLKLPVLALTGLLTGFLSGYLGIGGGVVLLPVFAGILHLGMKLSVGTSSFVILIISLYASVSYLFKDSVDFVVAIFLVAGAAIGAILGASALMKVSDRLIKISFASVSVAVGVSIIFKEFGLGQFSLIFLLTVAMIIIVNIAIQVLWKQKTTLPPVL